MQSPIEINLVAIRQRAPQCSCEFPQTIDFAILDPADRRPRFDRSPDHETRRGRAAAVGAEAGAQRGSPPPPHGTHHARAPPRAARAAFSSVSRPRVVARLRVTNSAAISWSLEPK